MSGPPSGEAPWPAVDAVVAAAKSATTSLKGLAALGRIHKAACELRRHAVKITPESVASACGDAGPKARSIRNSDRAMSVVRAARGAQVAEAAPAVPGKPLEVQVLQQIADPAFRAMAEAWFAERRARWHEVCQLRAAARTTAALRFVSEAMLEAGVDRLEELVDAVRAARGETPGPLFDDTERAACRRLLERGLGDAGMGVDEASGEIVNHVSRTVAERGVASALRKVAGLDGA